MWASDNDAFKEFKPDKFVRFMRKLKGSPHCLFFASPDVVGDASLTLEKFDYWHRVIHAHGFPVALVAQDGLENEYIPWDKFEALFVGGTTRWKMSDHAEGIIMEAKRRKKWIHIGRVNGTSRIRYFQRLPIDSIDGSSFSFNRKHIKRAIQELETTQYTLPGLLA